MVSGMIVAHSSAVSGGSPTRVRAAPGGNLTLPSSSSTLTNMELMWSTPVKKLAEEKVIPQYHAELAGAQIAYLLADKISPKGGRDVLAKIRKATATEKAIADLDLVLIINEEHWHSHGEAWQVALLDHEFCHVLVEVTAEGDIQKYHDRRS